MIKSPYDTILEPIVKWSEENYYANFLVNIEIDGEEVTEFLKFDVENFPYVWETDWWEGQKDIRLLGFKPISDIHIHNYPRQTNADRIRNMSDEELAKWMCTEYRKVPWCRSDNEEDIESGKCRPQVCIICANVWLKEEVTE